MATRTDTTFEQFMATRREAASAYATGDGGPVGALSTTAEPASFFGPGGGIVTGAETVRTTNEEGAGRFAGGTTELEVLHAGSDGDLGYWVGIQHAEVRMRGATEPVAMQLRVTELFRREGGEWKLVHRHADQLAEDAPARG